MTHFGRHGHNCSTARLECCVLVQAPARPLSWHGVLYCNGNRFAHAVQLPYLQLMDIDMPAPSMDKHTNSLQQRLPTQNL